MQTILRLNVQYSASVECLQCFCQKNRLIFIFVRQHGLENFILSDVLFTQQTWFESIRQKMKDNRRGLTSDDQVMLIKKNFRGQQQGRQNKENPLDLDTRLRSNRSKVCNITSKINVGGVR
jgi:hypothetical protein